MRDVALCGPASAAVLLQPAVPTLEALGSVRRDDVRDDAARALAAILVRGAVADIAAATARYTDVLAAAHATADATDLRSTAVSAAPLTAGYLLAELAAARPADPWLLQQRPADVVAAWMPLLNPARGVPTVADGAVAVASVLLRLPILPAATLPVVAQLHQLLDGAKDARVSWLRLCQGGKYVDPPSKVGSLIVSAEPCTAERPPDVGAGVDRRG